MKGGQRDAEFRPELYDEISPGYYDLVYQRGRGTQWFWHHHRFGVVTEGLPAAVGRIIDLGCGPGTFLGNLKTPFEHALGIDLAAPQIAYAQSRYRRTGLEFRVGDVTVLDPGQRFNAAVSIEVVEHLRPEDTQGFFSTLYDLLEPGGTLVLTTPNYRSFWPLLEWLVSKIGPVDYREQHINPFDRGRLRREAERAGFVDVRCQTFFVIAPFLASLSGALAEFVLRWERRLLPWLGAELALYARKPV
ncbi:MAG TPA: methyltransferase domain-containing protein [Thermoanaerobaculia bacterium]